MGLDIQSDLVVDTQEHCFVCLIKVSAKLTSIKVEPGVESPYYSLQCLSRYLKMDISKVISDKDHCSTQLLGKIERSTLKVRLCEGCVSLTEKFAKLYQQLEKIEMEVYSCASRINEKFLMAEETGKEKLFGKNWTGGGKEKLRIAEILRNEAILKGSKRTAAPRIKLQNLQFHLISEGKLTVDPPTLQRPLNKVNSNLAESNITYPSQSSDIEIGNIKVEIVSPPGSIINEGPLGSVGESVEKAVDVDKSSPETTPLRKSTRGRISRTTYKLDPGTGQYKCKRCPKQFPNYHQFHRHRSRIHLKAKYVCSKCPKEFNHLESRERHHQTVHIGVRFRCNTCNKIFTLQHNLYQHQKTKSCGIVQVPQHKCNDCGKVFTRSNGLQRHLKSVHLQLKEYNCNQCGKSFHRNYQLNNHQRKDHLAIKVKNEVNDPMSD